MWYYLEEGQQRGPVMDADLEALHKDGKITSETLVWREGMANWQPLREARGETAGAAPQVPEAPGILGHVVCSQCGRTFPPSDVIRYGNVSVCAACKPIFVQKLKEGTHIGSSSGANGLVSEAEVRERDYEHDVGDYLSKSWAMFKSDAGGCIAAVLLVGLCLIVATLIPYLSVITSIVFIGPLLGGLYIFFVKKVRDEPATLGDAFSGFGPRFGHLLLGRFIPNLLAVLAFIPVVVVGGVVVAVMVAGSKHNGGGPGAGLGAAMIILGVLALAGFCVMVYLQVCWMFTLWLVADKHMSFWPAMGLSRAVVRKHWWQTLWLGIVAGFLALIGILLCLVGALVTWPLCLGIFANAYERLFGDLQPE